MPNNTSALITKRNYSWILLAILIFALDRITKFFVISYLPFEQPVPILPILNFLFTFNSGAAFSFLRDASMWHEWFLSGIAITVSIAIIIWQFKISAKQKWLSIALALILGGTLSNLLDRIVYHQVIDFLDFYFKQWHYATFNIADAAICSGAVMLVVDIFMQKNN